MNTSDIGLIGLAVMGQNLALNIADHGFRISVFNRTFGKTEQFMHKNEHENVVGYRELKDFIQSLSKPRKIIIMVQAGNATDAVIESLLQHLDQGDVIIDGGNAKWTDTIRREKNLHQKGFYFVGSGVSGGEEGARLGPSLMPGGTLESWNLIRIFGPVFLQKLMKIQANPSKVASQELPFQVDSLVLLISGPMALVIM